MFTNLAIKNHQLVLLHHIIQAIHYLVLPVAIYGNILVVGAPYESYNNLEKSGSVYIFEKDVSGNWNHLSRITNPTPNEYDYFGHSVSIYDDLIVVGSINSEDNYLQTNDAGHVYVYR